MFGQLTPSTLAVYREKGGQLLYVAEFGGEVVREERRAIAMGLLQAPAMIALLEQLRVDFAEIVNEATKAHGGGVLGLAAAQADPDYKRIFERQQDVLRLLAKAKGGA